MYMVSKNVHNYIVHRLNDTSFAPWQVHPHLVRPHYKISILSSPPTFWSFLTTSIKSYNVVEKRTSWLGANLIKLNWYEGEIAKGQNQQLPIDSIPVPSHRTLITDHLTWWLMLTFPAVFFTKPLEVKKIFWARQWDTKSTEALFLRGERNGQLNFFSPYFFPYFSPSSQIFLAVSPSSLIFYLTPW